MLGIAFAVPLLVPLPNRHADPFGQTDPFGELRSQPGVRRREREDFPQPHHGKRRQSLDSRDTATVRADQPQDEGDRPRGVHVERLEHVSLAADVVAKPLCLLGGIGMAVDIHHQPEVIRSFQLAVAGAHKLSHPQGDHRLPHAMRHRLSKTQVSRVRQRRHHLRDSDVVCFELDGHA